MKKTKLNYVAQAGNIAKVHILSGQNGRFGTIILAVDDGYFDKGQDGQNEQWIDRTYFFNLKVNENNLKTLCTLPAKGDQLVVEGKLINEDDKQDTSKKYTKIDVARFVSHTPKALIDLGKAHGVIPQNQSQHNNYQPGSYQKTYSQEQAGFHKSPSSQSAFHQP